VRVIPRQNFVAVFLLLSSCALDGADDNEAFLPAISGKTEELAIATSTSTGAELIWSESERKKLSFCVEKGLVVDGKIKIEGFGDDTDEVIRAAEDAARAWASIADVRFSYVAPDEECDYCDPRAAGKNACQKASKVDALFAIVPGPGSRSRTTFVPGRVLVGTERLLILAREALEDSQKLEQTLLHEFGHALGFLHEHQRPDVPANLRGPNCADDGIAPIYDLTARGVTAYDRYSAMHYPAVGLYSECGGRSDGPWYEISFMDAMGAPCIYGNPGSGTIPGYCDVLTIMPAVESPYVTATAPLMLSGLAYVTIGPIIGIPWL
jgi:hypothetical protein